MEGHEPRRRNRLFVLGAFVVALAGMAILTGCGPEAQAEIDTYAGINAIRAKHGLPALQPDKQLVDVARARSRDMAARDYFSHNPPDGCNFVCIMDGSGVGHAWAGENIAWNNWDWDQSSKRAVFMWENSPPHLQNILNCHYTRMGTGVAKTADGRIFYTMIFEGGNKC